MREASKAGMVERSLGLSPSETTLEEGVLRGRTRIIGVLKIRDKGYERQGMGGLGLLQEGSDP